MLKQWLYFLVIPMAIGSIMIALHFSGRPELSQLIVPVIEGIAGDSYREWGLLENLQNIYLIACIVLCAIAARDFSVPWQKILMILGLCGFLFLFLEEIDYGRHYYDIVVKPRSFAVDRNLHNIDGVNRALKVSMDLGVFIWFVLFPAIFFKSQATFKKVFIPSFWYLLPITVMVFQSKLSRHLNSLGLQPEPDFLLNNLSEFKELGLYYVFMLYLIDIVIWRPRQGRGTK